MSSLVVRRTRNLIIFAIFATAAVLIDRIYSVSLIHSNFRTGWLLLGCMLLLTFLNARKKLPFLPLWTASTWVQIHIYVGLLSVVLFFCHIGFRVPNGALEVTLALLFLGVAGSGVFGLLLSRWYAKRLTSRGAEVIYERIPRLRRELVQKAEELVVQSADQTNSTSISQFYQTTLAPFLIRDRNFWWHLMESGRPLQVLLTEIASQDRYLNDKERELMRELAEIVRTKNDLDYCAALQGLLKRWLFVHIPLTYSLLIFSILHVLVAYSFYGGAK